MVCSTRLPHSLMPVFVAKWCCWLLYRENRACSCVCSKYLRCRHRRRRRHHRQERNVESQRQKAIDRNAKRMRNGEALTLPIRRIRIRCKHLQHCKTTAIYHKYSRWQLLLLYATVELHNFLLFGCVCVCARCLCIAVQPRPPHCRMWMKMNEAAKQDWAECGGGGMAFGIWLRRQCECELENNNKKTKKMSRKMYKSEYAIWRRIAIINF